MPRSRSTALKRFAVKTVKPRVSDPVWQALSRPSSASEQLRLRRMNLNELAEEFGTDKWGRHWYTQHYQRHLEQWRRDRFTLLEIGIGGYRYSGKGGASLRMWKQFFPKAQIVGLDLQDKSFVDEPRIRAYQGSQTDEAVLRRIIDDAGSVRVIIDDGSHRPEHIRETFRILFPLLEDGGIYVIEDTQTSYWPTWGGSVDRNSPDTTMALVKDLIDGLNHMEFVDEDYRPTYSDEHVVGVHAYHNLVFIEKGRNDEGTNKRLLRRERNARAAGTAAAEVPAAQ